ncbi:MAG: hypothetical protein KGJ19_02190, partial [Betaproteobacteria bacterium]|nr:hypothetical protein [Betaproteobacteria bacterium]
MTDEVADFLQPLPLAAKRSCIDIYGKCSYIVATNTGALFMLTTLKTTDVRSRIEPEIKDRA